MTQAPPRLTRWHRLLATFGGAAIIVAIGAVTYAARAKAAAARSRVDHTYAVIQTANDTRSAMQDAETGLRGFVITGTASYLGPYHDALVRLAADTLALRSLTRDNPLQQRRLDTLGVLIAAKLSELSRAIDARRAGGIEVASAMVRSGEDRRWMDQIRTVLEAVENDERTLLVARRSSEARWRAIVTVTLILGTLAGALVAVFVNGLLTRFAVTQEESARLLATQNSQLREQARELELQHRQLQDQATELELQNEQLQQQATELEAQTEQLQQQAGELEARTSEAERAQQAAVIANAAKSEFLAAMSHELRTPLNAISGYADLLLMGVRGPIPDSQLEDLRRIKRSSQHLLSLINEILNLARIEAGHVDLHVSDVPVAATLEDVVALVAPQMRAKGLTCTLGACDPAMALRTDVEKLRQVLLNLLTNASKFTGRGGRVAVACDLVERGFDESVPSMVRIRVADTGRGIPEDKLNAIFEPFVQIDRRLTPESEQGIGLGLAISRDLARAMGGDLAVESVLGSGSTFALTLPSLASDRERLEPSDLHRRADRV